MTLTLAEIEQLAPDQASLTAASKLTNPSKWPRLEKNASSDLYWGECQGSGSNPYRVVIDAGDHGYKCTCPSRKFPCKHSLALMWISAGGDVAFDDADTPEWVIEWMSRRRKSAQATEAEQPFGARPPKNIEAANRSEQGKPEDPEAARKREEAAARRREKTQTAIAEALDELDQWISDQLRTGLNDFVGKATDRCRRIAARMVDLKAGALGGRIDEIPSRLMGLDAEEKPTGAMIELGKLVIIAKAWRRNPDDAELRRIVATSESREQVLSNAAAVRVFSTWEVVGEQVSSRPDGLVSHSTWLLDLRNETPRFALLLDFHPASAGRRDSVFVHGERFEAELAYYPATVPLRAVIVSRQPLADGGSSRWPEPATEAQSDPLKPFAEHQVQAPWLARTPLLLHRGSLAQGTRNRTWWRPADEAIALPLANSVPDPALGLELKRGFGVWDGLRLDLLSADTVLGRVTFNG